MANKYQVFGKFGGNGLDVTGATVGQTVRIAAVDDNGVPTAWEPADFADKTELVNSVLAALPAAEGVSY